MLFVTGDCHGDFRRFSAKNFPIQKKLTKEDYLVILGDAALVWDGSKEEEWWLDWFESKPFTTINIGGNHENYDRLERHPRIHWNGGEAIQLRPSVLHLCRGHMFDLNGYRTFVMGGAQSHDTNLILQPGRELARKKRQLDRLRVPYRAQGESWWPQELPSQAEHFAAWNALREAHWAVDLVLTHCAPTEIQAQLGRDYPTNDLTDFFQYLLSHLSYHHWLCGHYHLSRQFPEHKFRILNEEILQIR